MRIARRYEPCEMERAFVLRRMARGIAQNFVIEKTFVVYRERDARKILVHRAPRTDREVPHFAISRFPPGQADRDARGFEGAMGIIARQGINRGKACGGEGIRSIVFSDAPSIKY